MAQNRYVVFIIFTLFSVPILNAHLTNADLEQIGKVIGKAVKQESSVGGTVKKNAIITASGIGILFGLRMLYRSAIDWIDSETTNVKTNDSYNPFKWSWFVSKDKKAYKKSWLNAGVGQLTCLVSGYVLYKNL